MAYISSSDIKMYPTARRDDDFDRNARLNTEQNLVSIINRLTNIDSFVIQGLSIENGSLTAGSCNIHGYVFNILNDLSITVSGSSSNNMLALQIRIKKQGDVEELIAFDTQDINSDGSLDVSQTFKGLQIAAIPKQTESITDGGNSTTIHTLPIAYYDSDKGWVTITNKFGINTDNNIRPNTLTIDASNIRISNKSNTLNSYATVDQDLINYLNLNLDIDDGEMN